MLYCKHCDVCLEGEEITVLDPDTGAAEGAVCPWCRQEVVELPEDDDEFFG